MDELESLIGDFDAAKGKLEAKEHALLATLLLQGADADKKPEYLIALSRVSAALGKPKTGFTPDFGTFRLDDVRTITRTIKSEESRGPSCGRT